MHWRPDIPDAFIGDMIPFFWDGHYHIFFLQRRGSAPYPWRHIVSSDLRSWDVLPDVVSPSPDPSAPDARGCWTGSVVHHDGTFYCFYTGWNPDQPAAGKFPQTICLATSRDLIHWEKSQHNPILLPDPNLYSPSDWRDPFVFYNPDAGEWWMVICATDARHRLPRPGVLALATSPDLQTWHVRQPFWPGGLCHAPECPDVFAESGRWYTVYSHGITRYRLASSPAGPWLPAAPDTLDGPFVRAAKTLSDGHRRLLFGWVPTLDRDQDSGPMQWGGHMALPRVLLPGPDGALLPSLPEEFRASSRTSLSSLSPLRGHWSISEERADASAPDSIALARLDPPSDFILSATITLSNPTTDFGFLVRMSESADAGWKVAAEQTASRLALYPWQTWGDPEPKISRPLCISHDQPLDVHLICHGSIIELFIDGAASLATRAYAPPTGWLGFWVSGGSAAITNFFLDPLPPLK